MSYRAKSTRLVSLMAFGSVLSWLLLVQAQEAHVELTFKGTWPGFSRASVFAVAAQGNYAYVGADNPSGLVIFDVSETGQTADAICAQLRERGVLASGFGSSIRGVTHYDVARDDIETALRELRSVLN